MKNIIISLLITGACLFTACNDFLDKMPDNRAELNTEEKLTSLLVSAYPAASFITMTELMSDNTADNGPLYTYYSLMVPQCYNWEDVSEITQDSPQYLWDHCYIAIASANHVLQTIKEIGEENCTAQKGEALLCRAYAHFVLVNIFCQHYNEQNSTQDMGIPYVEEPETVVFKNYDRGTVAEVYEKIARDIEEGLPLINDQLYDIPKYHFNYKAACAFAARFYLYYRKFDLTIKYATLALGDAPNEVIRDYLDDAKTSDLDWRFNHYISAELNCNLLILPAKSYWPLIHGPYTNGGKRYGHSQKIAKEGTIWSPGLWGENLSAYNTVFGDAQKLCYPKLGAFTEYTDKVAGIGYINIVYPAFTTDETLLCRAEAYVYQENYALALADMNLWLKGHTNSGVNISPDIIHNYYTQEVPSKKVLHPKFSINPGTQESFIHFILHCRRIETIHDGLRWFDIKRYGIEVVHNHYESSDDILTVDDPRRAIQLPAQVIGAGLPANPR